MAWSALPLALAALLLFTTSAAHAQDAPAGTIGSVEGPDISVESGTAAGLSAPASTPGIYVVNGSVVTVHSGQARMTLASGGQLGICGPAKFTVLESGGAITLALSFGRIHVQIPAAAGRAGAAALRIFTPAVIATPLGIGNGERDITVGLELDTSLCVLASSGAVQLEHQFTGEKLIAPQAGEFFLASGKFAPVAGAPGGCNCSIPEPREIPSPPAPEEGPGAKPLEHASALPARPAQADSPAVTAAQPVPLDPPAVPEHSPAPALMFLASAPWPQLGPDVVLLARKARVEPDWEFTGHVAAPELAREMEQRRSENSAASSPSGTGKPAGDKLAPRTNGQRKKKSGGFWASVKRFFSGSEAQD